MTDLEITGDQKYHLCMGYLHRLLDQSIEMGDVLPATSLGQISAALSLKFLNDTLEQHREHLERQKKFDVGEAVNDIIQEIKHDGKTSKGN